MYTIENTIEIAATPDQLARALTTKPGIEGWWTNDTDVDEDRMTFRFEKQAGVVEVGFRVDERISTGVAMTCVTESNNHDWLGTRLAFTFAPAGDRTRVSLVHSGYPAKNEVYEQCVKGWAFFLGSLKSYLETGTGEPHVRPAKSIVDVIDVAAPATKVLEALTTRDGIAAWWTVNTSVDAAQHVYRFGKGNEMAEETFRVEQQDARGIALACIAEQNGIGWLGTRLAFSLEGTPTTTRVALTHSGFAANSACYEECVGGWRHFLGSLKAYVETGKGTPHIPAGNDCH